MDNLTLAHRPENLHQEVPVLKVKEPILELIKYFNKVHIITLCLRVHFFENFLEEPASTAVFDHEVAVFVELVFAKFDVAGDAEDKLF